MLGKIGSGVVKASRGTLRLTEGSRGPYLWFACGATGCPTPVLLQYHITGYAVFLFHISYFYLQLQYFITVLLVSWYFGGLLSHAFQGGFIEPYPCCACSAARYPTSITCYTLLLSQFCSPFMLLRTERSVHRVLFFLKHGIVI